MFSGILKYREKDLGKIWSLFDLLKLGIKYKISQFSKSIKIFGRKFMH